MTTFTTEDRINASPPHIVGSGASVMGMTVNELAVYLEDITDSEESAYRQAATMLRQQQAEISLLQEYVCQLESGLESSLNLNKAQAERHGNNEPVAWIAYDEFGDFMLEATPEGDYPWQPLYTHPHPDNLGFALSIIDQQKLEISELKQYTKRGNGLLAECNEHMGKLQALILKQDARIAELEKCAEYYRDKYYFDSPAKTLTDEEIDDIASMCSVNEKDQINDREFARAILKKATEK